MAKYDVIIVGAGIPGLYLSRELTRVGRNVLIIDSSPIPGEPNYSTAGIPVETLDEFDLPRQGVRTNITRLLLGTSSNELVKEDKACIAYVLDFKKTKSLLAEQIRELGGEVRWGWTASKLVEKDKEYSGVETIPPAQTEFSRNGNGTEIIPADFMVDATGATGKLATQASIREKEPDGISIGKEHIVRSKGNALQTFDQTLALYFGHDLSPHGYAWVFANGDDTYKIGLMEYWVDPRRRLDSIDHRLNRLLDWIGREKIGETLETHGGAKYLSTNFPKVSKGNILAVGDAIGSVNPLFMEGIRHGLYSAKFALEGIVTNNLNLYSAQWKRYKGWRWKIGTTIARRTYNTASQDLFEECVKFADKNFSASDIIDIGFYYRFERGWKHPIGALKILCKWA